MRRSAPALVLWAGLLCSLILFSAVSAVLFVWPRTDRLKRADAVLSLNGNDEPAREQTAISLVHRGYAPLLLFSMGHDATPCPTAADVTVVCFVPDPSRTVGELRFVAQFARVHHLRRILIVAGHEQVVRAGLLARRCVPVATQVVPAPVVWSQVPFQIAYEWGATAKALLVARGCGNS